MTLDYGCINLIKEFEGFRSRAYLCPSGVPTIGWGHTKGVQLGMVCTESEADGWLLEDLAYSAKAVRHAVKVPMTSSQFSALVSFVFNVGVTSFLSSTLLKLLNQSRHNLVPGQLKRWVYGKDPKTGAKVALPGLVRRREREAALWEQA